MYILMKGNATENYHRISKICHPLHPGLHLPIQQYVVNAISEQPLVAPAVVEANRGEINGWIEMDSTHQAMLQMF